VADRDVREQLCAWGAQAEQVTVCGIPTDAAFGMWHDAEETRRRHGIDSGSPLALLMGGGMGPTRMDAVAALLCQSGFPVHLIAVTGRDARARRRLTRLTATPPVSLRVLGWADDVPALMRAASVLVTKPGGLTTAEAALSTLPVVFFDAIPGPERRNAARVAAAGAGVIACSPEEAANATLSLLRDEGARRRMADCAKKLASPNAAATVARLALDAGTPARGASERMTA
jgi:processive 1,2-diacylglycerol beta-glucosyltransferase